MRMQSEPDAGKWLSESRADRISGRFVRAMVSSANHQSGNNSNVYNYV